MYSSDLITENPYISRMQSVLRYVHSSDLISHAAATRSQFSEKEGPIKESSGSIEVGKERC